MLRPESVMPPLGDGDPPCQMPQVPASTRAQAAPQCLGAAGANATAASSPTGEGRGESRPQANRWHLGLWIEQTEGAKFWLKVINDLKTRGVNDILIAVVDGLKGFPEAIASVYPQTVVQTCIVHLIRNSLAFVAWKDRKAILPAIKAIYRAENADMALVRLEEFEDEWGKRYPAIGQAWRRAWEQVVPFFAFAPGVRKMIYTTNAVEALHRSLRKIIKTRGSFPNDDAALKLLYLAIKNAGLR